MTRRYDKGLRHVTTGSGVYAIVNTRNGKAYVGSALCIRGRLCNHRCELIRGRHYNSHLQRAWNKYGAEAFRFEVLEECEPCHCVAREQEWIDVLETFDRSKGYNLNRRAGNDGWLGRKHSAESRKKMSESQKGNQSQPLATAAAADANRGKHRPEEVKAKIAAAQKGREFSEEHRANIKARHWRNRPDWREIVARSAAKHQGKSHDEVHREKIAQSVREAWKRRRVTSDAAFPFRATESSEGEQTAKQNGSATDGIT